MDKYYYELTVRPSGYFGLFLDLVSSLTNDAIEESNDTIVIRDPMPLDNLMAGINKFTQGLNDCIDDKIVCDMNMEKKENQDWIKIYQESIQPITVGDFFVHPSWVEAKKEKINIQINPALTFGSGHHQTTYTCLEAINKYVKTSDKIIDVGCGSGILGIASAKLGAIVDICDTDNVAVEDAIKNFELNEVKCNDAWEGSANSTKKTYDVVLANIVADVLVMIHKDIKKITNKNGVIILSGIMDKYKSKVLARFEDCTLVQIIQKDEWITLILKGKSI